MAVYGFQNLSGESMEEQSLISCVMASKVNYESVYSDCINLDEESIVNVCNGLKRLDMTVQICREFIAEVVDFSANFNCPKLSMISYRLN